MNERDGGPAYPTQTGQRQTDVHEVEHDVVPGMTLRDHFAGLAMQAMCDGPWPDSNDRPEIAKRAYAMADDMIAARSKR